MHLIAPLLKRMIIIVEKKALNLKLNIDFISKCFGICVSFAITMGISFIVSIFLIPTLSTFYFKFLMVLQIRLSQPYYVRAWTPEGEKFE